jgi:leucyl aminopeptidase (aminopeptidase T)
MMVIAEESFSDISDLIWTKAKTITHNSIQIKLTRHMMDSGKLPAAVKTTLDSTTACVILTSKYIEVAGLNKARRKGTRFIVIQRATKRLIERCIETDYSGIANKSKKLAELFTIGKSLHITSSLGSDLMIPMQKMVGTAETGMACNAGEFSYLPAGEACLPLNAQHINGRMVIDCIAGQKKLVNPIVLLITNSQITQIKGSEEADELRKLIRKFGKEGRRIQELGIGTNDKVAKGNSVQEDEKISGSLHIAFGSDRLTKVQGRTHDAVRALVMKPSLCIDGREIIRDGVFLV